jgi:Phage integrase, N-terminal SAM-like domain
MVEISPLRCRMIEDMTVRNLSPATEQSYLSAVSKFSRYYGRSPDLLGLEVVHVFLVHLVAKGILDGFHCNGPLLRGPPSHSVNHEARNRAFDERIAGASALPP